MGIGMYVDTTGNQILPSWSGVVSLPVISAFYQTDRGRLFSLVLSLFSLVFSQYDLSAYARTILLCDMSPDSATLRPHVDVVCNTSPLPFDNAWLRVENGQPMGVFAVCSVLAS